MEPAAAGPPGSEPTPAGTPTRPERIWREERPVQSSGRSDFSSSRGVQIFLLLSVILALGGFIAGILSWLGPEPSPCFLPLWVTEHRDPSLPMVPMGQRDLSGLRSGDFFACSLGDPIGRQDGHALVEDLVKLKSYRHDAGLVVYVRAHALRDGKGDLCILPADAAPDNSDTWLPLRKILESLRDSPTTNKLLVLDIMSPLAAPRLASLFHDVASAIPAELAAVPDPSRLVLCSCSPGQVSFDSEELGRSVFSYYFEEALLGYAEAGYTARQPDAQVSVQELANFVRARVDRWALHNRGLRQTPILYGTGQDFPLLALDHGEARPQEPKLLDQPYPPWLIQAWKVRDEWLRDGTFRLAPRPFMQAQTLLLLTERNWCCSVTHLLDGEGEPAEHLQNRFQVLFDGYRAKIERARSLVQPVTMSLAQQVPPGSQPDPKLTRILQDWLLLYPRQIALANPEEVAPLRAKMLDDLRDKTKDFSATALEQGVFQLALQDTRHDQGTLRLLEQVLQRPGQPLSPTVEIHTLGQLAELAARMEPSAWPADLVGRVLDVTHKAELATSDARVFAWIRPWLDEAAPFRHEGEVRLWARGYASLDEADRLLKLAGQNYQGALQQGVKVREGLTALNEAYAVLPFFLLYLETNPTLHKTWDNAVLDAAALAELLRTLPPRDGEEQKTQHLFQVGKRIVDVHKLAISLRDRLQELEKPFAPEQVQRLIKQSKQPQATGKLQVQMAALLRVPHPALAAEDRAALCKATQALAKRLLEDTLERDRDDNARLQPTAAPEPWDEDLAKLQEQSRARERGRTLASLLELGGLNTPSLKQVRAALQKAGQESTPENWSRAGSLLRKAWSQQLPAQYQAEDNPLRREQLSWILAPLQTFRAIDDAEVSATTQVRWHQAQEMWRWISDHLRFRARDYQGLGLDSPALAASARFYARAALANQDFVRLPLEAHVALRTPGTLPDITAERPYSQVDLQVQRFMPEDSPGSVELNFLRPDNAWLLVSPTETTLPAVPDPTNAPRTITNTIPLQIALKPGAQRSQTPRPDGILAQARLNGRAFHRVVAVPLSGLTQELQLFVSGNPKEPEPPLQEIRLRPGKVRQNYFLYVKNLTNKTRKVSVEIVSSDGVVAVAAAVVGPQETQPLRLEDKSPPVAPPVPPLKEEKAPPPASLPELSGPLEIRLRDAETQTTIANTKLRVNIASPREYVNVTDIRFDPATPQNEGKNKLAVKLQALAAVPGPPIPADLVLPARRIPGFLGIGGGTFHGEIPNKDKLLPITLFAEKIALPQGSDDEGPVYVNIDGVERSFIFRASLGRSKDPSIPRGDGRPAIRIVAEPFAQALTHFLVPVETDNAPAGATVEVAVGRLVQGEFEADAVRRFPDARQRTIGFVVQKGSLAFEAQVRDWVAAFDTTRILGQRILRARLLDEADNELLQTQQNILIDSNAPALVRFVDPPPRVKRGTTINLKAQAQDSESGVAQAVFFFGKPQDGKIPPNAPTIAAAPVDMKQSVWAAQVPLPADSKGPLPITVQFVNRVGLSTFETTTIELTETEPGLTGLGKIQGKVTEGPRAQPGLEVILRDEKGKELSRTKSQTDGSFVFDKLKPGRYSVYVRKPDSQRSATMSVLVQADKTSPAALSLSLSF